MDAKVVFTKAPSQQYCVGTPSEELKAARVCVDILSRLGCYLPDWAQAEVNAALARHNEQTQRESLVTSPLKEGVEAPVAAAPEQASASAFDMRLHLQRQREWSEKTFGPGERSKGVVDHIRKELCEIEAAPLDLTEWIDVVILALDGAWRAGYSPDEIISALVAKQTKNEGRQWPDWRTAEPGKAIEHVKQAIADDGTPETDASELAALHTMLDREGIAFESHCEDERGLSLGQRIECLIKLKEDLEDEFAEEANKRCGLQTETAELQDKLSKRAAQIERLISDNGRFIDGEQAATKRAEAAERERDAERMNHEAISHQLGTLRQRIEEAGKELPTPFTYWIDIENGEIRAKINPNGSWVAKNTCDHIIERATILLAAAQERIAGLEVAFRVNILSLRPEISHEEIDAVIAKAKDG